MNGILIGGRTLKSCLLGFYPKLATWQFTIVNQFVIHICNLLQTLAIYNRLSIIILMYRKNVNVDEKITTFYDDIALTVPTVPIRLHLRVSKS